jgi:phage tail-like protein
MDKDFLYNNLPEIYRTLDVDQKYILKRFLETIQESGMEPILNEIVEFANLNDIDKLNEDQLKLLAKTFGYEYDINLSLSIQKRLIKNLIEIYKRKGTSSSVVYVTKEITEFDVEIVPLVNKMFRTWSNNSHLELPGYESSKTFKNFGDSHAHYLSGNKFTKKNIYLKLLPLFDIGLQFERSLALIKILDMLLPVYTKAFLLLSSNEGEEIYIVNTEESVEMTKTIDNILYIVKADIEYLNINIDILASLEDKLNNDYNDDIEFTSINIALDTYEISSQNFNDTIEHLTLIEEEGNLLFPSSNTIVSSNLILPWKLKSEESNEAYLIVFKLEDEIIAFNSKIIEDNFSIIERHSLEIETELETINWQLNTNEDGTDKINLFDSYDFDVSSINEYESQMSINIISNETSNTLVDEYWVDTIL